MRKFILLAFVAFCFFVSCTMAQAQTTDPKTLKATVIRTFNSAAARESIRISFNTLIKGTGEEHIEFYFSTKEGHVIQKIKTDLMRMLMFESGCMLDSLSMSENTLEIYFREKIPKWKVLSEFVNKLIRMVRNDIAPQSELAVDFSGANPMVVKVASP